VKENDELQKEKDENERNISVQVKKQMDTAAASEKV